MDHERIRSVLLIALLMAFFGAIGVDIYGAYRNPGDFAQGMKQIVEYWTNHDLTKYFIGFLCGHFFWSSKGGGGK